MKTQIKTKGIQLALGVLCIFFMLLVEMNDMPAVDAILERIDGFIYDNITRLSLRKKPQTTRVVTIDIDDASVKAEGRWPWPRDKFVTLLSQLKKAGVVVVVFDIVFSDPEINYALGLEHKIQKFPPETRNISFKLSPLLQEIAPLVDNDQAFSNALRHNDVVLGYLFHGDATIKKGKLPNPLLNMHSKPLNASNFLLTLFSGYNGTLDLFAKAAPLGGFVSNIPDIDGAIRHGLMLANYDHKIYISFVLSTIMHYLMTDQITLVSHEESRKQFLDGIKVGGLFIPTNRHGQILIPYFGLPGTIDSYSATDILNNRVPANALAGSIAIVGSSMVLLADLHQSPVAQNFPGFEIVANMVSGILSQQIPSEHTWNTRQGLGALTLFGLVYAVIFSLLEPLLLFIIALLSFITLLGFSYLWFYYYNIYIPPSLPLLFLTLQTLLNFSYKFLLVKQQKNQLRELFGQYIPASHIKEIIEDSKDYSLSGETREMSVFFSDIRNFTNLTESLDASEVKRLLNAFFSPVTDIIFKNNGTIDKYVGDMVMAFWGAPIINQDHANNAIATALEIRQRLPDINKDLEKQQLPTLGIGMGINSGLMNVGDMGSNFRRSYTVLGDAVNLASRLQDLTKFYKVDILVSESTRANQNMFIWRPVDKVAVKGRQKSLMIYQPLGHCRNCSEAIQEELKAYEEALESYYQKDWLKARLLFNNLHRAYPQQFLYDMYVSRIEAFQKNPPGKDWDGTFTHLHK